MAVSGWLNQRKPPAVGDLAKSQEPRAKSQEPTAKSYPTATLADAFAKFSNIPANAVQAPISTMYTSHGERSEKGFGSGRYAGLGICIPKDKLAVAGGAAGSVAAAS